MKKLLLGILLCGLISLPGSAQIRRIAGASARPQSILNTTLLSVAVSPSQVSFNLVSGGSAVANTPISINTTLQNPLLSTVNVYAFLPSTSSALTGNSSSAVIPSAALFGLVPNGAPTTYTAFTQTEPLGVAGASLQLLSVQNLVANLVLNLKLYLKIDLTSFPQLPADTYVGQMYIQAQVL